MPQNAQQNSTRRLDKPMKIINTGTIRTNSWTLTIGRK